MAKANYVSRICQVCGFRVRVNEGRFHSKMDSGEWLFAHQRNRCPESDPAPIVQGDVTDDPAPGVKRITPEFGARKYDLSTFGFGQYPSVTSVLGYLPGDKGDRGLMNWNAVESAHRGIELMDLLDHDYKAWKKEVQATTEVLMNEASVFGTSVHDAIEELITFRLLKGWGEPLPDLREVASRHVDEADVSYDVTLDRVVASLRAFLRWESEWVDEWIDVESVMFDPELGWAGAADGYGMIAVGEWDAKKGRWVPTEESVPTKVDWKTSKFNDWFHKDALADGRAHRALLSKLSYRVQVAGAYANATHYVSPVDGSLHVAAEEEPVGQAIIAHVHPEGVTVECIDADHIEVYGEMFRMAASVAKLAARSKELQAGVVADMVDWYGLSE